MSGHLYIGTERRFLFWRRMFWTSVGTVFAYSRERVSNGRTEWMLELANGRPWRLFEAWSLCQERPFLFLQGSDGTRIDGFVMEISHAMSARVRILSVDTI